MLHDIRIRRALSLGLTSSTGDAKEVDMLHLGADDHRTNAEQFVCAGVSAHGQRLVAVTTRGQVVHGDLMTTSECELVGIALTEPGKVGGWFPSSSTARNGNGNAAE